MYCTNCGKKNRKTSVYCKYCGSQISEKSINKQGSKVRPPQQYKSLGGWLVIVGIGLVLLLIRYGYQANDLFNSLNDKSLSTYNNPYSPLYTPNFFNALYFELYGTLAICGFSIYLLVLYFKKRKNFPKYYIYFVLGVFIFGIIDYMYVDSIKFPASIQHFFTDSLNELAGALSSLFISNIIWISYMVKSKRVKATFIN